MQMTTRYFSHWWSRNNSKRLDAAERCRKGAASGDRRKLLQALAAMTGSSVLSLMSQRSEAKDSSNLPRPKRALTGRDEAGKSVFKSFDVTSKVVEIDANPGLTFYELYMTEGVPGLSGLGVWSRDEMVRVDPEGCRV